VAFVASPNGALADDAFFRLTRAARAAEPLRVDTIEFVIPGLLGIASSTHGYARADEVNGHCVVGPQGSIADCE